MTALLALWLGGVSLAGACSPELAALECVDGSTCGVGETCRAGRCLAAALDVASEADADTPSDAPTDPARDESSDADRDATDENAGDPTLDPDLADVSDGDTSDQDAPPEVICPPEIDCLDGLDSDQDGTDGQAAAVILVDAVNGTFTGDGTLDQPVRTLARALEIASLQPTRNQILLGDSRYTVTTPFAITGPLTFFEIGGGYDPANWSRTPERTQLLGSGSAAIPVLRFEGIAELRLSQLEVAAPQGAPGTAGGDDGEGPRAEATAGQTSIAVWVTDSTVLIRDANILAGDGGEGARGRIGRTGVDGAVGGNALEPVGAARPGGVSPDGLPCFDGRPPPGGGPGGPGSETGAATEGARGDGLAGGVGGDLETEPVGARGESGGPGENGVGAGPYGYIRGGTWHPVPGSSGRHGPPGSGGGGGSSGFDEAGGPSDPGGGGASGACGGEGGGGGSGGGGSIALYLEDAGAVLGPRVTLRAANGGDGRNGGSGGSGGTGQGGGSGWGDGVADVSGYAGGPGGNGGAGGVGGGGSGGVSVAVVLVGTASLEGGARSFGTGGSGGSRPDAEGTPTNAGRAGYAGEVLAFQGVEAKGPCRYGATPIVDPICLSPAGANRELCLDLYEAVEHAVLGPLVPDPDPSDSVGQAIAIPSRLPWVSIARADATVACARGGGFVCEGHLLSAACGRAAGDVSSCNFASGALAQTGVFCFNADGAFDLLGNAAEWVAAGCTGEFEDTSTYGGSYLDNAASPDACTTRGDAVAPSPQIGFRCCSDPGLLGAMEYGP